MNILANKQEYIIKEGNFIKILDGSINEDIVINSEDKEYVQQDNKLLDEEREAKREMYFRHSRMLYPDKEEWILSMAVDAFMEQQDKGIDITTYKFGSQDEPPTPEEKFDTPEEKFDTPEEKLENLAVVE
jgi:1,2-phenylacetyl-CoA epoxidase PaaB subunit